MFYVITFKRCIFCIRAGADAIVVLVAVIARLISGAYLINKYV